MPAKAVKLSCERCRRRKTKCDKGVPCSACKNVGISCTGVERARLPRGPSGKVKNKTTVLETRVARLEDLLRRVAQQKQTSGDAGDLSNELDTPEPVDPSRRPAADKMSQFYAKDIWLTLSEEVAGLRETLEASDDEDQPTEDIREQDDNRISTEQLSRTVLFNHSFHQNGESPEPPPAHVRSILLRLYHERVDCLFKITHWPTVFTCIETQYTDAHYRPSSPSNQALEFSIYFLAVCSINDLESRDMLSEERQLVLQRYRIGAETLISRANLLHSPDLTVLQAFVLYLKGIHSCMQYTTTWTLLATAVRVASAFGPLASEAENWSEYDLEVRRRIWHCIGALDFQTAANRGSEPLFLFEDETGPPLLMKDSDISPPGVWKIYPQPDTDMSLMYVYRESSICMKKLFARPIAPEDHSNDWRDKVRTVAAFRESMKQHSSRIHDPANPFRLCAQFSTNAIAMDMELYLRRPPFRVKHIKPPLWDDFDILGKTTEIMELNLTKPVNTTFAPWAWFAKPWVRWYILAVLLAELCTPRDGDLAKKAYVIAKESFARYGDLIADTDLRTLWQPLLKLMRHVDRVRDSRPLASRTCASGLPSGANLADLSQPVAQPLQSATYTSRVVMSYEPDAREKVMEFLSTKDKTNHAVYATNPWKENGNDWVLTSSVDTMDESSPSRIWDSFLDDIGGYNRCFM